MIKNNFDKINILKICSSDNNFIKFLLNLVLILELGREEEGSLLKFCGREDREYNI